MGKEVIGPEAVGTPVPKAPVEVEQPPPASTGAIDVRPLTRGLARKRSHTDAFVPIENKDFGPRLGFCLATGRLLVLAPTTDLADHRADPEHAHARWKMS